jgi:hypothetical protein
LHTPFLEADSIVQEAGDIANRRLLTPITANDDKKLEGCSRETEKNSVKRGRFDP